MKRIKWYELVAIVVMLIGLTVAFLDLGRGEEATVDAWVLVKPGSYVNARGTPKKSQEEQGRLETGHLLHLDGETRNGYAHCVDMGLEIEEGWVHTGYIVLDEPVWSGEWYTVESDGRVAVRKWIGGPVDVWLKPSSRVQVFYWSEEWCLTTRGYVKTEYLVKEDE